MELPDYRLLDSMDHSGRSMVYRALRRADDRPVLIKTTASDKPSRAEFERYQHEHAILNHLAESPHVAHALGFTSIDGRPFLITEDRGGRTLESLLHGSLDIPRALNYGIAIVDALADIHSRGVIHKDINPNNIIFSDDSEEAQIIDFGISALLPVEHREAAPPPLIAGTLAYISPEQTGRMNRGVDHRSDLYSLGITLYRMLTGMLPYRGNDPLEWCHRHLAQQPEPPRELRRELPSVLSKIVLKLLAKVPEDRYQSAHGLARDLRRCREEMKSRGTIASFTLAQDDHNHGFQIPEKLYGREQEIATLLDAFAQVVGDGRCRPVLVAGYSGIGKSALVHELHKPILKARGRFLTGKFDQYKRDIPYATIAQAFQGLIRQILGEEDAIIAKWRQRIQDAVGVNGRVVTDVIPELELIIGPQPLVPELGPSESQNRFNMVMRDFIRVLAREECPLAIFLDDMQWADSATLQLLQSILADASIRYICLLLAYRDNEVDESHPFMLAVDKLRRSGIIPRRIDLMPLARDSLAALVADTMHVRHDAPHVLELAQLIAEKTGGNPFFVIQFLKRLHHDGLLRFDFKRGRFDCDPAEVARRDYTDNVIEHMVQRLRLLDPRTQTSLRIASCIGNRFGLADLCAASSTQPGDVAASLWPAIEAGLVVPMGQACAVLPGSATAPEHAPSQHYRFQHDRIQQAAYSMLDEQERTALHLRLGRSWRAHADEAELEARLFDITNQLNRCIDLIESPEERQDLARLNLRAGRKAKASTAHASAVRHQAYARDLLPEDAWDQHYDLALAVHTELAECLYLNGEFEPAERQFKEVTGRAHTLPEKASIHILRTNLYQVSGNYDEGVELAIEALGLLGIQVPRDPDVLQRETEAAFRAVQVNMRGRRIRELVDAPLLDDPMIKAIVDVAHSALPCAYIARPQYFGWFALLALNKLLEHGNTEAACFVYSAYGFLLPEDPRAAYEFSSLSLELNERFQDKSRRGALLHLHGDHFNYFYKPIHTSFPVLERGFVACQEVGDLVYAGFIAFSIVWQFLERGDTLDEILEQSHKYATFAMQTSNMPILESIRMEQQFMACLQGRTRSLTSLSDVEFDEAASLKRIRDAGFGTGVVLFHIIKQILHFHSGEYAASLATADTARPLLGAARAMPIEANYYLFRALAACALYDRASPENRVAYRADIEEARRKWTIWAESCPENFRDRYLLLLAEIARIDGEEMQALHLYEQAAQEARQRNFMRTRGLASEMAGRFCLARKLLRSGITFLDDARHSYEHWGADGLVARLEHQYPELRAHQRSKEAATTTSSYSSTADLDATSVLKATHALSGELQLTNLVQRLLTIAMENAGADRGVLLMLEADDKVILSSVSGESSILDEDSNVPRSVIKFVQRTGDRMLLADAIASESHRADPYIARERVRSLLCLPVVRRGELMGMLYLENRLLPNAFTGNRVAMLEVIATQAAISLENARLYSNLERLVEERTHELREAQAHLVRTAHRAGMAEIASSILHNVGNVLNSINSSIDLLYREARGTRVDLLGRAAGLLQEHDGDLATFLTEDEQGKLLPALLRSLATHMHDKNQRLLVELEYLRKRALHINSIMEMQGKYAGPSPRLVETCLASELVDDALQICATSLARHDIVVKRDYVDLQPFAFERHRVLQILINLITNAKDAMLEMAPGRDRVLTVRVSHGEGTTVFEVRDNGKGIDETIREKIFTFGFTTRQDGHGIGLHASAIDAQAMGGSIRLHSEGPGLGASFILTLPLAHAHR